MTDRTGQLELEMGTARALERAGEWVTRARKVVAKFVAEGIEFTADDVRDLAGDPPANGDAMGAMFRAVSHEGWVICIGRRASGRPDAHRREVKVWRGKS